MHRTHRLLVLLLLVVSAASLFAPIPGLAQSQQRPTKRLIDGEWRFEGADRATPPTNRAAPPATTQPAITPAERNKVGITSWGRTVFSSYGVDGNWEIYTLTPVQGGTLTANLSRNHASDTQPRLSPDASQVVFVSDRDRNVEIYRMQSDGSAQVRLTAHPADDTQPFWSPDGGTILFASKRDGNWNIYRMSPDGSGQLPLTSDPSSDIMPSWSPDGGTIAWVRAGATSGAIWLMNADGSNPRPITGQLTYLQHPIWSPDSTRLAFDYDHNGDGFNDLGLINADGSGFTPVPVTPLVGVYGPDPHIDLAAGVWNPTGTSILLDVATYTISSSRLKLVGLYLSSIPLAGGMAQWFRYPAFDMQPDVRSLDLEAPRTAIEPLPAYTRGTDTTVRWSGADEGLAGAFSYDLEVRVGAGGWAPWKTGTDDLEAVYTGAAGSTVAFRVRGRDDAGNTEAWRTSTGATAATTFYAHTLVGTLTDNRGLPMPATSLGLAPAPIEAATTGLDGAFLLHLKSGAIHTALPARAGYGSPPATALDMQRDRVFSPYLLPLDNRVQNSGFEASATPPAGWSLGGTLPISVTTSAQTGARAAQLGQPCALPCLGDLEQIPYDQNTFPPSPMSMVVDSAGAVHMLGQTYDLFSPLPRVYYQTRSPAGVWSAATLLEYGTNSQLAIDGKQQLHRIWVSSEHRLLYSHRPAANGSWSASQDLGLASEGRIYADSTGKVYVSYYCYGVLGCDNTGEGKYRIRAAGGSWQAPRTTPTTWTVMAIGADDTAYMLYGLDYGVSLGVVQPDGSLGKLTILAESVQVYKPQIAVDALGTVYIAWGRNADMYVMSGKPGDSWPEPQALPLGGTQVYLAAGPGQIYLVNEADQLYGSGYYLRTLQGANSWSVPAKLPELYSLSLPVIAADRLDRLHIVRGELKYAATRPATAGSAAISQSISIAANMHRPTLAFDYSLSGVSPTSGSRLVVRIAGTPVYTATVGGGWAHAAIDLQPWLGQTVALALELQQAAGASQATALLDDVSVGSWRTPVIQQVTPAAVVSTASATEIEIAGENFLATPTIRLGTTTLANVQLVDAQTLRVTIPAGTKPGRYPLWVINPGGQAAAWPILPVGHQIMIAVTTH